MKEPGYSAQRTAAKHRLLNRQAGREIGAAPYIRQRFGGLSYFQFKGILIVDLTAGDADPDKDPTNPLGLSSSPLIFAKHAAQHRNIRVRLYEHNRQTFKRLIENLEKYLPQLRDKDGRRLHFERIGRTKWVTDTNSTLQVIYGDGSEEDFSDLRRHEWLLVNNDPNTMAGWCLDMVAFGYAIETQPAAFMSTMGCNSGGLKRLPLKQRKRWWRFWETAKRFVDQYPSLALILVPLTNDPAQWAYLHLIPRAWVTRIHKEITNDLKKEGLHAKIYAHPNDAKKFNHALEVLLFTKAELARRRQMDDER
jgi:hypothetical protein